MVKRIYVRAGWIIPATEGRTALRPKVASRDTINGVLKYGCHLWQQLRFTLIHMVFDTVYF